jgi:bacteriocin-like protein
MDEQDLKKDEKPISSPDTLAKKPARKSKIELNEEELRHVTGGAIDAYISFKSYD